MADEISPALRRQVASRAGFRCEYCLMPETELFAGCEVDHIISRKHHGQTDATNLALSCERCNRAKGTDVGSVVGPEQRFVRFFNPRTDAWPEHFRLERGIIQPRTEIGQATAGLLRFN